MTRVEVEDHNKRVVTGLYNALNSKDKDTLHRLLAQDMEWWFHGPPCLRHHLIPSLTATSSSSSNHLVPNLIVGFGSVVLVIAEGYDEANMVWWVRAWTATADGVITQVREYVNTSVTVTGLGMIAPSSSQIVGSSDFVAVSKCQSIWKSKLCCDQSVPGVIVAI